MSPRLFAGPIVAGVCLLVAWASSLDSATAQEWTRFRGPNGQGECETAGIPVTFTKAEENWRVKLPGNGNGSPVLWGDKIFLLSAEPTNATRHVFCLSAKDGSTLWSHQFASATHHLHARNSYASSTAVVDADFVFATWATDDHIQALCFDHAGKQIWQKDLGAFVSDHGFGTSPMLVDDLVVINNHQMGDPSKLNGRAPGVSTMVALDRKTGEVRWQTPRESLHVCYSVPCVYTPAEGEPQLVCTSTTHGLFSLDPKTGRELWSIKCFEKRTISSPIFVAGLFVGTTGEGSGDNTVVAVRPGPKAEVAYEIRKSAPYVPTPVCHGELMFLWTDRGVCTCVNAKTGEQIWQNRIGGNYYGSPIRVRNVVYCMNEEGELVAIAAAKEFQLLGKSSLGELSRATPAVAGGRMYLRTLTQLISVGGK